MNKLKTKIVVIASIVCILAISIAGNTIAYFTDVKSTENTFTYGTGVKIRLTEQVESGNYTVTSPGQVLEQNPTITNEGDGEVYVAGIITLKSDTVFLSDKVSVGDEQGKLNIMKFFSGGAFAEDQTDFNVKATTNGTDTFTVYIVYKQKVAINESVELFDGILVPASWDYPEMKYMQALTVTINAYATQTVGFANADEAINGAFGGGADSTNGDFTGYFN